MSTGGQAIRVVCTGCQKAFNAPVKAAGKKVRCPVCQTVLNIPATSAPAMPMPANVSTPQSPIPYVYPQSPAPWPPNPAMGPQGQAAPPPFPPAGITPYPQTAFPAGQMPVYPQMPAAGFPPIPPQPVMPQPVMPQAIPPQPMPLAYQQPVANNGLGSFLDEALSEPTSKDDVYGVSAPAPTALADSPFDPRYGAVNTVAPAPRSERRSSGTSGTAIGGLATMVIAVIWFFAGASVGVYFIYPPIMFVAGLVTFLKGLGGGD